MLLLKPDKLLINFKQEIITGLCDVFVITAKYYHVNQEVMLSVLSKHGYSVKSLGLWSAGLEYHSWYELNGAYLRSCDFAVSRSKTTRYKQRSFAFLLKPYITHCHMTVRDPSCSILSFDDHRFLQSLSNIIILPPWQFRL